MSSLLASAERGGKFLPPARGGFTARFVEDIIRLFLDPKSESLLALELVAGRGSLFSPALEIRQEEFMVIAKLGMKLTPFGARAKGAGDWILILVSWRLNVGIAVQRILTYHQNKYIA